MKKLRVDDLIEFTGSALFCSDDIIQTHIQNLARFARSKIEMVACNKQVKLDQSINCLFGQMERN